jgi:CspA family cold shock protein
LSNRQRAFRPPRRRGLDDDNYEATPRSGHQPASAFGTSQPRFEQPPGPAVRALVKWYNPEKGFGFVELANGSGDAFLHAAVLERAGHDAVDPGATLEVRAGPGQKGMQVTEVLSIDSSTATQEPARRARPERPAPDRPGRPLVQETGTVKFYNAAKGYGFIGPGREGCLRACFSAQPRGNIELGRRSTGHHGRRRGPQGAGGGGDTTERHKRSASKCRSRAARR